MTQEMETINFISGAIFSLFTIINLFIAYNFWASRNGELRKIMILKNISLAAMFFTFSTMIFYENANKFIVILACLPYFYAMLKLTKYLLNLVKSQK